MVEPVPRSEWPQAITAVSVAYNAARAIGPTLAGVLFARLRIPMNVTTDSGNVSEIPVIVTVGRCCAI